jgi:hypothetical protein
MCLHSGHGREALTTWKGALGSADGRETLRRRKRLVEGRVSQAERAWGALRRGLECTEAWRQMGT